MSRAGRVLAAALAAAMAAVALAGAAAAGAPDIAWRVVAEYPHDAGAFTQGLVLHDGALYESTGLYGASTLRKVRVDTGRVVRVRRLPAEVFGEGIALIGNEIFQLTWRARRVFVYRVRDFGLVRELVAPGAEGWGLTHDGRRFVLSDGSATLRFVDPATMGEIERVEVHDDGRPIERLNELEWVGGSILANVWQSDRIARIDPSDGRVTGWLDLAALAERERGSGVLNGIAWDAGSGRLLVTGKNWTRLFALESNLQ